MMIIMTIMMIIIMLVSIGKVFVVVLVTYIADNINDENKVG